MMLILDSAEVHVKYSPGFEVQGQEDKVLWLHKSFYGLKQSARQWSKKAIETLAKLHFKQGKADQCLSGKMERDGNRTYVLLYADDMPVVGSTEKIAKQVDAQLEKFF
uniref:Reverse transcriptase Ty1/copia-type domain-containing protein n=1 Tax=Trichuris muris TaxID=70415 RepID=A0A5S6QDB7_TRIMR